MQKKMSPLQEHLLVLEEECKKGDVTLSRLFQVFGNDSHYVIILFLILPFLQPIPLFGLSTPLGFLIGAVAWLAFVKKPPFVPFRWKNKLMPKEVVLKIASGFTALFERISFLIHPRWGFTLQGPFRIINTLIVIWNCFLLALPLPVPFTNTGPACAIFCMALAFLEEDGLFVLLSYVFTILTMIYFGLIAGGVKSGLSILF